MAGKKTSEMSPEEKMAHLKYIHSPEYEAEFLDLLRREEQVRKSVTEEGAKS